MVDLALRQALTGHAIKGTEGGHCVSFHSVQQLAATGGADAAVKIWQAQGS